MLQWIGLILIIGGTAFSIYDIMLDNEPTKITQSKGLFVFLIGLLLSMMSQRLDQKK